MPVATQDPGFFDRLITKVSLIGSGVDYEESEKRWAEQNAALEAHRQALLDSGTITTVQSDKLKALDQSQDIAAGNAELFVKTAADANNKNLNSLLATLWRALPWWVWSLGAAALVIYFLPALIKLKKSL